MSYLDIPYKGSYAWTNVKGLDLSQLKYRLPYVEGAVSYHKKEGNEGQVTFFSDELKHVKRRIAALERNKKKVTLLADIVKPATIKSMLSL